MFKPVLLLTVLLFGFAAEARSIKLKITDSEGKITRREYAVGFESETFESLIPGFTCTIQPSNVKGTDGAYFKCEAKGYVDGKAALVAHATACPAEGEKDSLVGIQMFGIGTIHKSRESNAITSVEFGCTNTFKF